MCPICTTKHKTCDMTFLYITAMFSYLYLSCQSSQSKDEASWSIDSDSPHHKIQSDLGKTPHAREHEVALFPSEDGAFPQGAKRSDLQSPSTALPVPLQILPGLLWGETQPVRLSGSPADHEERHLLQELCGGQSWSLGLNSTVYNLSKSWNVNWPFN